jgi:hypothetical protein
MKIIKTLVVVLFTVLIGMILIGLILSFIQVNVPSKSLNYNDTSKGFLFAEMSSQLDNQEGGNDYSNYITLPIKYKVTNKEVCGDYETKRIEKAFNKIKIATNGSFYFRTAYDYEDADITISCLSYEEVKEDYRNDDVYLGEAYIGLPSEITLASYLDLKKVYSDDGWYLPLCDIDNPTYEIHEILHALGFEHKEDENSIMNPIETCSGIDKDIITELSKGNEYLREKGYLKNTNI